MTVKSVQAYPTHPSLSNPCKSIQPSHLVPTRSNLSSCLSTSKCLSLSNHQWLSNPSKLIQPVQAYSTRPNPVQSMACPIHGILSQLVQTHLSFPACPICAKTIQPFQPMQANQKRPTSFNLPSLSNPYIAVQTVQLTKPNQPMQAPPTSPGSYQHVITTDAGTVVNVI